MFLKVVRVFLFIFSVFILVSCSDYNRVLKGTNNDLKFERGMEYYQKGKYEYAVNLFEDLIPIYRGTSKSEKVYYYFAMCFFNMEDYYTAGLYLRNFVKTFPKSELAESCAFTSAMCSYYNSPKYSLDQSETVAAINNLQLFLNRYPETSKKDSCNTLIQEMREKLEKKHYEISRQYYKTERYKAAVVSLRNTIKDYPNSTYEEDMMFMMLKANYELAVNSVKDKKLERLENTIKAYEDYVDRYPSSKRINQAENIYQNTRSQIEKSKTEAI